MIFVGVEVWAEMPGNQEVMTAVQCTFVLSPVRFRSLDYAVRHAQGREGRRLGNSRTFQITKRERIEWYEKATSSSIAGRAQGPYRARPAGSRFLFALISSGCGNVHARRVAAGELTEIQEMLARNPGAIESRDGLGKTPLFFAVTYGREDMMDFLIERGADVNAHDNTVLTPLHVAAFMSRPACAEKLLKAGARIDATDNSDNPSSFGGLHGMTGMIGFPR